MSKPSSKLTLTVVAVLAGLAVTPANAFVDGAPTDVPTQWPVEGAFDKTSDPLKRDRETVSTRGQSEAAPKTADEARRR